jgi:hypothetical protein
MHPAENYLGHGVVSSAEVKKKRKMSIAFLCYLFSLVRTHIKLACKLPSYRVVCNRAFFYSGIQINQIGNVRITYNVFVRQSLQWKRNNKLYIRC